MTTAVTIVTARRAVIEVQPGPWPDLVHIEVEGVITGVAEDRRGAVARVMCNLTMDEARKLAQALRSLAP